MLASFPWLIARERARRRDAVLTNSPQNSLQQLHAFRHWMEASIRSLESLEYGTALNEDDGVDSIITDSIVDI